MKFFHTLYTVAWYTVSVRAFTIPSLSFGQRSTVRGLTTNVLGTSQSIPSSFLVRYMSTGAGGSPMTPEEFIRKEIASNGVTIFSKSYCPFCTKTKETFAGLGVSAKIYELNQMDDGPEIQDALLAMTGQRTVPNVFVNGEHVGGNDKTQEALASGKLLKMLEKVK